MSIGSVVVKKKDKKDKKSSNNSMKVNVKKTVKKNVKQTVKKNVKKTVKKTVKKYVKGKVSSSKPTPLNKRLYNKVVNEATTKFLVYPSAYASGWITRTYKQRGGTYEGSYPVNQGLNRWFKEKWINVCKLPKIVPCGRSVATMKSYPYCRPMYRVSKDTPMTVGELSVKELRSRCSTKRKAPLKRVV